MKKLKDIFYEERLKALEKTIDANMLEKIFNHYGVSSLVELPGNGGMSISVNVEGLSVKEISGVRTAVALGMNVDLETVYVEKVDNKKVVQCDMSLGSDTISWVEYALGAFELVNRRTSKFNKQAVLGF